ncbi:MAG TPA: hypothetical protein VGX28_05690 [Frankiaceae bacterium]|jgi:hypothetical protein|nr:hypothetical protein [Frankiaceae bacterium]
MAWYRFVPVADAERAAADLGLDALAAAAARPAPERARVGEERVRSMLAYAAERVPAYRGLDPSGGLAAFPWLSKADVVRGYDSLLAGGAAPGRVNRTSGSTNTPLRTALGPAHEANQVVRWLRHWAAFGLGEPAVVTYVVPRAYRLRVFGGGALVDLAGGHEVRQVHPGADPAPVGGDDVVVANPHVLESVYPGGFGDRARLVVTSYEQRPRDLAVWDARGYGDVYGLSEVGDVAYQVPGDPAWHLHDDLVALEVDAVEKAGDAVVGELVVTDLTNDVMPLIRYRTGDIVVARADGARVRELRHVAGRAIAARGTCLAGVDVCSTVLPALLDTGVAFRLAASPDRAVAWLADGARARDVEARLRRHVPAITVTADPADLDGLREVLVRPVVAPP